MALPLFRRPEMKRCAFGIMYFALPVASTRRAIVGRLVLLLRPSRPVVGGLLRFGSYHDLVNFLFLFSLLLLGSLARPRFVRLASIRTWHTRMHVLCQLACRFFCD
jgi:hypothetical protein